MIQVVRQGDGKFKLIDFVCPICDCAFMADKENYTLFPRSTYLLFYCNCPTCGAEVATRRDYIRKDD